MVLTVDEAKQHLRIDYDEEDELIETTRSMTTVS